MAILCPYMTYCSDDNLYYIYNIYNIYIYVYNIYYIYFIFIFLVAPNKWLCLK